MRFLGVGTNIFISESKPYCTRYKTLAYQQTVPCQQTFAYQQAIPHQRRLCLQTKILLNNKDSAYEQSVCLPTKTLLTSKDFAYQKRLCLPAYTRLPINIFSFLLLFELLNYADWVKANITCVVAIRHCSKFRCTFSAP